MARSRDGHIEQLPDGRWLAVKRCGYMRDGSTPREMSKVVATERDATLAIARMSADMGRRPHLADGTTLEWYREAMYVPAKAHLARSTMRRYDGCWRRHIEPAFGDWQLGEITHADVQAWLYTMTPSEADHSLRALHSIMSQAVQDQTLDLDLTAGRYQMPADAAHPVEAEDDDADGFELVSDSSPIWDAGTVARAMPLMRGVPIEGVWLLMVGGGLREEEANAVRWGQDVRFEDVTVKTADGSFEGCVCRVAVHHAHTEADGRKATKNRHSRRVVAIPEPFSSRLRALDGERGANVRTLYVGDVGKAWARLWGRPLEVSTDGNGRYYRGRMAAAGVPFVELRTMRHTNETIMQQAGVLDTLNAAIHGRSRVQTGYDHYLRPGEDATMAAVEAVRRAVSE